MPILGPSLFHKNSNPSKNFQTMFLCTRVLPVLRISIKLDYIWVSKGPKICHFMDAELVRKTLKIFNLTTTTGILMKLLAIMHIYEIFNLSKIGA